MNWKTTVIMIVSVLLVSLSLQGAEEPAKTATAPKAETVKEAAPAPTIAFKDDIEKISYAIGTRLGQSFKMQNMDINIAMLLRGIEDVLAGKQLALTEVEMIQVMKAKQDELNKKQNAANVAFLAENKSKPGVKVTGSGLQYKVIKEGTGGKPTIKDRVKVHYRGTLVNGQEFDSSYKRNQPATFPVGGVIAGWTEALQLMKEGAKWQLFIPANLAYKERGSPPRIPPNSPLIFEVELLEIVPQAKPPVPPKAEKLEIKPVEIK